MSGKGPLSPQAGATLILFASQGLPKESCWLRECSQFCTEGAASGLLLNMLRCCSMLQGVQ